MESYEKLLKKAEEEMPEKVLKSDRFEVDKVLGHIEGNKTVIVNLGKIAKQLSRPVENLLKYLLKELATPGKFVRGRAILGSKVAASRINKKIKQYVSEYVLCPSCYKPDTKLNEKKGIYYIKCLACGAERPVKSI